MFNKTKKVLMITNPSNFVTKKVIRLIKRTQHNINGIDILNLIRKNMKICDRISEIIIGQLITLDIM